VALAALTFAVFSAIDAMVKWMTLRYPVVQVTFYTSVFALVPVAAVIAATGGLAGLKPRRPGLVVLRAVLLALDTVLIYYAFNRLPLADAYAMVFTTPLLVTALSVPLLGEKVGWRRWSAVAVGFAGVLIILRPGFAGLDPGHFAALGSALLFALALIVLRRVGSEESSGALLLALMLALIAVTGPALPFVHRPLAPADLGIFAAAGMVIGVSHLLLILALRTAPAASVAPFQYTQIIWAVIYGLAIFGDRPDAFTLAGSLVVIASGLYVFFRETVRRRG
jgi:drug/metabolite transporter (DMT)-like permease